MHGGSLTHRRNAFTLAEILIVVIILGIVAALVIMSTAGTEATAAAAGADVVARDLELARSEAQRLQTFITVTFSEANDSYEITDAANNIITHPLTNTAETIFINNEIEDSEVSITSVDFGSGSTVVVFDQNGEPLASDKVSPISSDSKIVVTSGSASYSVKVAPITGRVLVKSGT
jgi:prepilin-type N-terminal cleavage/methylation domain-containing protein